MIKLLFLVSGTDYNKNSRLQCYEFFTGPIYSSNLHTSKDLVKLSTLETYSKSNICLSLPSRENISINKHVSLLVPVGNVLSHDSLFLQVIGVDLAL